MRTPIIRLWKFCLKGIFGSSRLLFEEISRGCEECDCFLLNKVYKKIDRLLCPDSVQFH